jgi:type II secretory pathway pseudopilin PulG
LTTGRRAQQGAVGALVIAIMVIILLGIMATYVLSRISAGSDEVVQTQKRLATAAEALDAFAAASSRLPCPANPEVDDGLEVRNLPAACQFPEGTLPWRTIGLKRDDAYDAWGRKISWCRTRAPAWCIATRRPPARARRLARGFARGARPWAG